MQGQRKLKPFRYRSLKILKLSMTFCSSLSIFSHFHWYCSLIFKKIPPKRKVSGTYFLWPWSSASMNSIETGETEHEHFQHECCVCCETSVCTSLIQMGSFGEHLVGVTWCLHLVPDPTFTTHHNILKWKLFSAKYHTFTHSCTNFSLMHLFIKVSKQIIYIEYEKFSN